MDRASRPGNAGRWADGLPASGFAVSRHKLVEQSRPTPEAGLPQSRDRLGAAEEAASRGKVEQSQGARNGQVSGARHSDPGTLVDQHEVGSRGTGQKDGISLACGRHSSVGNGWEADMS